jgi:DNA-binding transcriptional ArsR family regulator
LKRQEDQRVRRIHFTADDLARLRLLPTVGPLAEAVLSLKLLRGRPSVMFDGWRAAIRRAPGLRHDVLGAIFPAKDPMLDLVTLARPAATLEQSAESLLACRSADVRQELDFYAGWHGGVPAVLRDLPNDVQARRSVIDVIKRYHDVAIAPSWSRVRGKLEADRLTRSQRVLDHGIDGLLASLHPMLRWERPVLSCTEICHVGDGRDVHLDGKGLLLAPSFFQRTPVVLSPVDPREQPILIFPIPLDTGTWADAEPRRALANLLGRTRATVLLAISDGAATTGQLADRVGASAASISQHTAVLREAGLITSHRYRNTVHHMLASPGAVLINGN